MKSVILRLGLILLFLVCVIVRLAYTAFEDSVVLLLVLILAGVWGILLKPNNHDRYNGITIYDPPMSDKDIDNAIKALSKE